MNENNNEMIIYGNKNGVTKVNVKFTDEDIWLTQNQISDIYQTIQQNISQHINEIYKDKELQNFKRREIVIKMIDWIQELNNQILYNRKSILEGNGKYHTKRQ